MASEIWLTERYYEEFHARLEAQSFTKTEAVDVYQTTQLLMQKWPACIGNPPPEIGNKRGLFYVKFNWPTCRLRICFGAMTVGTTNRIVVLTCRTKQELSKGSSNGTTEWYKHMATVGEDRWDDYQRGYLKSWQIY